MMGARHVADHFRHMHHFIVDADAGADVILQAALGLGRAFQNGLLDAVKLVESGYAPLCHAVWLVTCPEAIQIERMMTSRGLSNPEVRARLASQPSLDSKRGVVTETINNDGTLAEVRHQVTEAWQRFIATLPSGEVSQ